MKQKYINTEGIFSLLILDSVTWSEAEIYTRHSQKSSDSHVIAFFKRQWHIPIFQLPLQHHTDRGTQSPILKCTLLNKFYVIKQNNMSTIMQSAILYCEICLLKEKLYSNQSRDMVRSLFFFKKRIPYFIYEGGNIKMLLKYQYGFLVTCKCTVSRICWNKVSEYSLSVWTIVWGWDRWAAAAFYNPRFCSFTLNKVEKFFQLWEK